MARSYDYFTRCINYLLKAEMNFNEIISLVHSELLGGDGCRTHSYVFGDLGDDKFENPWLKNNHLHYACLYDILRCPSFPPGQWLLIDTAVWLGHCVRCHALQSIWFPQVLTA